MNRDAHRAPPRPAAEADNVLDDATRLERNLRGQLEAHQRLLACIERNRDAVRRADMDEIRDSCEHENEVVQHLAELEKERLRIVGRLTARARPGAARPLSLHEIAESLEPDAAHRLTALGAQLKTAAGEVRRASSIVRGAAEALSRHMGGLMQSVQTVFGKAQVYGRKGRLSTASQRQFCVDVTS